VIVVPDVVYREVDGEQIALDVYLREGGGPFPAVLVIHGGAWKKSDKSEWAAEGYRLADLGFVAFVANHRLAPPGGVWHAPAPVDDLHAAVAWIRENQGAYNADATRVGALAASSGGHLAMMIATTGTIGMDRVDVVVSWSGVAKLRMARRGGSYLSRANYVGCDLRACPERWDEASPYFYVDPSDPPMFLANSTDELIALEEPLAMAEVLSQNGIPHELRIVEGSGHGRDYEDVVWAESIDFLLRYLA
jgi:acetyl esterase/lipase